LLAGVLARFGPEPAIAVHSAENRLVAIASALVGLSVHGLTGRRTPGVLAAWSFAFLPPIWSMAVVTELYALSACCLSLTLFLLLRGRPALAGIAYALALGSYLPNLLVLPAVVWLANRATVDRRAGVVRFLIPTLLGALVWVMWNLTRARIHPPLGTEFAPVGFADLLRFLSASQYTTHPPTDPQFYLHRVAEHAARVARNLLGVGLLLAAAGGVTLRRERLLGPLALWLLLGLAYFTFHPYQDYDLMTHAAYVVLAIAIGCGVHEVVVRARLRGPAMGRAAVAIATGLPLLLFAIQVQEFRARSTSREVTEFARRSLAAFPRGAVVFARWERFTILLYVQQVHGVRPDVLLLERQEKSRRYAGFAVDGWRRFAAEAMRDRPVIVDGIATPELREPADAVELEPLREGAPSGEPKGTFDRVEWMRVSRIR
ncbi:MAG: hypothetical protein HOP12_02580, partial [Candidatus Eisenbacteria bacterium]|nr:hypothetical protein [Candidatus Eisenbacteria bacterium]